MDRAAGGGHIAADVAVAQIDIDVDGELRVLGADGGRPSGQIDLGDLADDGEEVSFEAPRKTGPVSASST